MAIQHQHFCVIPKPRSSYLYTPIEEFPVIHPKSLATFWFLTEKFERKLHHIDNRQNVVSSSSNSYLKFSIYRTQVPVWHKYQPLHQSLLYIRCHSSRDVRTIENQSSEIVLFKFFFLVKLFNLLFSTFYTIFNFCFEVLRL